MKVEFDTREAWEIFSAVITRLADEATLSDSDRAKIRRWRSDIMKPSGDEVRMFTEKLNRDLADTKRRHESSRIRKPDWRK